MFSLPRVMADLLTAFIPAEHLPGLELSTLEVVNESYVTQDLRERESDVVWRVRTRDEWVYLYVLLEFQSTVDLTVPVRLQVYVGLLYQDLLDTGAVARGKPLPRVLPVVLYNGAARWHVPLDIADCMADPTWPFRPQLRYVLVDESTYEGAPLIERNVVSAIFALENARTLDDAVQLVATLAHWLQEPEAESIRRAVVTWLRQVLFPSRLSGPEFPDTSSLQEVHTMLANRVIDWTALWREEGINEGQMLLLLEQMEAELGPPSAEHRALVLAASDAERHRLATCLLFASSYAELFGPAAEAPIP